MKSVLCIIVLKKPILLCILSLDLPYGSNEIRQNLNFKYKKCGFGLKIIKYKQ